MEAQDEFAAFVAASSRSLLRAGWLLTGDWASAEDLVQASLLATWSRWDHVGRVAQPYAYVRRVMVTTYLRWTKRRWAGELATGTIPDKAAYDRELTNAETHESVIAALKVLPPKQRAIVVLRYFADLTEGETAAALGCRVGTVKSQSAKALATLRGVPGLAGVLTEGLAP